MRPFYQDITGATDGSGNATINVKIPTTGEWHDLKFAVGMNGPAEWAINVNGRPYTFGRGRRVTLGPELIQDGETVTVSVIGGPINSNIDGTATGKSGSPIEILSAFTPSPNTIALDAAQPRRLLYPDGTLLAAQSGPSFQVPAAVNTNANFTIPTGATDLRISSVVQGGLTTTFTTAIFLLGLNTGIRYFPKAGTGQPFGSRQPITIPIDPEQDVRYQVQVSPDGTHALDVYVSALFGIEAVEVYAQEPLPVTLGSIAGGTSIPVPPPQWQVQAHVGPTSGSPASVASPAPGGVRALVYEVVFSLVSNAGGRIFNGRVWDGASGGTLIGIVTLGNGGGSESAALHRLVGSATNVLTFDFDFTTAAGEQQSITASGDFVT